MIEHIYHECNEHLRFIANKRDQLLAFYGVIVGALVISSGGNVSKYNLYVFIVFLIITVSSAYVFIGYMRWHTLYINSCITLQHLMNLGQQFPDQALVNATYMKICPDTPSRFSYFMKRSETWIFILFLVFSTSSLRLFIDRVELDKPWYGTILKVVTLLYAVLFFYFSYYRYRLDISTKPLEQFKSGSWLLNIGK